MTLVFTLKAAPQSQHAKNSRKRRQGILSCLPVGSCEIEAQTPSSGGDQEQED